MKSSVLFFLVFGLSSVYAETADQITLNETPPPVRISYGYIAPGFVSLAYVPMFSLNVGHRTQKNHDGVDLSVMIDSILFSSSIEGSVTYLHYFTPNVRSEYYLGAGIGFGSGGSIMYRFYSFWLIRPTVVFGKQYTNRNGSIRFWEVGVAPPIMFGDRKNLITVGCVFRYGFAL